MKMEKWIVGVVILLGLIIIGGMPAQGLQAQQSEKEAAEELAEGAKIEDLLNEKRYEEARDLSLQFIQTYTEAGREADLTEGLYIDLGVAYYYLKDYDKAVEALDKALEKNFWNTKTLEYKATCYKEMDKKEGIVEIYQQILELEPERNDILFALAHNLEDLGRLDEAMPIYDELVELDPAFQNVAYDVGALYYNQGDKAKAKECFQKSLEVNPDNENANLAIGKLFLGEKDNAAVQVLAIPYFEKFLEVTQNEALKGSVTKILGKLQTAKKELDAQSAK